ncbi:MAG: hypothetical protein AAFN93_18940, partial [Bacteroidota bacterium]
IRNCVLETNINVHSANRVKKYFLNSLWGLRTSNGLRETWVSQSYEKGVSNDQWHVNTSPISP